MKKSLLIISILIILSLSFSFSACSKSEKILPEDREIESIEILVFNDNKESVKQTLSDQDKQELMEMFNNLGFVERYQIDITSSVSLEEFDYMLTIHVAKKGIKKAYDYYVYIGRTSIVNVAGKDIGKYEPKYLRVDTGKKKFKGDATDEIVNLLNNVKQNLV